MGRLRSIATVVCFVLLSSVASFAAVQAISRGLPETMASNAAVLVAALGTEDVTQESRPAQWKLAQRVQRELHEDLDWSVELAALDAAQQQRFVENLAELLKSSLDAKIDRYFQLPEGEPRKRYLDRQVVEFIMRWAMVIDRASHAQGQPIDRHAAMIALWPRVRQWYENSTPEELERLDKFQKALLPRIIGAKKAQLGLGVN